MVAPLLAAGCAATDRNEVHATSTDAPKRSASKAEAEPSTCLVAILDGQTIDWSELRAPAAEIAGQQVLRDAVLDLRLERRLSERGIRIDAAACDAEEAILLATLDADRARALELLGAIRTRQGLGPSRYPALLRRNAGLRALVARDVRIDDGSIANAFDMLHGAKRTARLAVLPSLGDAERFIAEVRDGKAFTDLAVERSLDEGAARGGLLAPIARRDPSYPEALRAAIFSTPIGALSSPVLDGGRFYVLFVLSERAADGTTADAAHARCEDIVRRRQERLLMDALARELSTLDGVTIFDRAFDAPSR
ncbi:MAG: peptidylprolyl isomerase [bacterium]